MATIRDWTLSISKGGQLQITARLEGIPDPDEPGEFLAAPRRLTTNAERHADAAAMGAALEPKVQRLLVPGTLTAAQLTAFCRALSEISFSEIPPPPT